MTTHAPYGIEMSDDCATCPMRKDGFFCQMSPAALADFQRMKFTSMYPTGAVLFVESQVPRGVYMLCKGRVKLTMASPGGKTVIVRVVVSRAVQIQVRHVSPSLDRCSPTGADTSPRDVRPLKY